MNNPRPQCRECGDIIDPHTCIVVDRHSKDRTPSFWPPREVDDALCGLYCSEDCVLDAFHRGHAAGRDGT